MNISGGQQTDMKRTDESHPGNPTVEDFYDQLAPTYDAMTGFGQRFVTERPSFEAIVSRYGFRSALDAGCGSGFHAILLAMLGVDVLGVDASSEMLRLAEKHARIHSVAIRTLKATFDQLPTVITERFEAVVSMGNSLAHLLTQNDLERALQGMFSVLHLGGVVLVQVLNYRRILDEKEPILSVKRSGDMTFVRSYEYGKDTITFNIVTRTGTAIAAAENVQAIELRPVMPADLSLAMERVGFKNIALFGGISLGPFDPENSKDLVIVAVKP
jgi:ubiquinone/menaquinone biosynthesis C-methylase UbiE